MPRFCIRSGAESGFCVRSCAAGHPAAGTRVAGSSPATLAAGGTRPAGAAAASGRVCASHRRIMALNKGLDRFRLLRVCFRSGTGPGSRMVAAAKANCCATATDDGTALARSVALPAPLILPVDETATALAASVLLPAATGQAMAGMSCSHHDAMPSAAMPGAGCDEKMTDQGCCKEGCEMACGQSVPPTR